MLQWESRRLGVQEFQDGYPLASGQRLGVVYKHIRKAGLHSRPIKKILLTTVDYRCNL